MAVPYTFGSATTSIPLSQLDSNFATTITLGNTAIQLGNTVTTLNNMTLANATVSSGNATVTTLTAPTHNSASSLTFQTNGTTTAITVDTSQNVGIGTSSPAAKLEVSGSTFANDVGGSTGLLRITSSNNTANNVLASFASTSTANNQLNVISATTNVIGLQAHLWSTGANSDLAIQPNGGNVGIGTTSPAGRLDSYGDSTNPAGIFRRGGAYGNIESSDTSRVNRWTIGRDNASTGNFVIAYNDSTKTSIDTSGSLLVGGTAVTNSAKIEAFYSGASLNGIVSNDTASASGTTFFACSNNGTLIGTIARVGATSAVVYNTTSDQRLKSNIEDAAPVLDKLMSVQVRQYDWTEGDLHQDYGFVAQELEPLLSGIVTKGKTEEDIWQLDYSRLTPHLLKAIQEQQALITAQAATINALTARIVALEAK